MRLFVAVDPGKACLERIARATERLHAIAPDAKWVRDEGRHVTLVFLGDVEDERLAEVVEAARGVVEKNAPIALRFEGGGYFGGRKPRVLWVGVQGDVEALGRLHADLVASLAAFSADKDDHAFHPHLTLARAREARGDPRLGACAAALAGEVFGEITLGEVVVYRSELAPAGAKYTAMARLSLSAGAVKTS
jgi:RNA 2',3'-cyclic 3'-phosphodiesterase